MPRLGQVRPALTGVALTAAFLCMGTALAGAQTAAKPLAGASWDSIKSLPDWSGVWSWIRMDRPKMPVNARGQAQLAALEKLRKVAGDIPSRAKHCMLEGHPGGLTGPEEYTEEWLFTPGQVTMTQVQGFVRRIHTDGRKHHSGPPTYQGDSIGHWEGKTLVVDTVGLHQGNEIYYGFVGGAHMHNVEHLHLVNDEILAMENHLEAPEIFTTAYDYTTMMKRHRDWTQLEMNCAQNNRSLNLTGGQDLDLTGPTYSSGGAPDRIWAKAKGAK